MHAFFVTFTIHIYVFIIFGRYLATIASRSPLAGASNRSSSPEITAKGRGRGRFRDRGRFRRRAWGNQSPGRSRGRNRGRGPSSSIRHDFIRQRKDEKLIQRMVHVLTCI